MNERIFRLLVSFNWTTALATGWLEASVTIPWTERVLVSSFESFRWPNTAQHSSSAIEHAIPAGLIFMMELHLLRLRFQLERYVDPFFALYGDGLLLRLVAFSRDSDCVAPVAGLDTEHEFAPRIGNRLQFFGLGRGAAGLRFRKQRNRRIGQCEARFLENGSANQCVRLRNGLLVAGVSP